MLGKALTELYARAPRGIHLGLEPVQHACNLLGNPEKFVKIVHVAGTNGKGSVSAMIESIARFMSGGRDITGLYTSPHLGRFAERIRVNGIPIDDALLEESLRESLAVKPELTFFEAATVGAFLAFRSRGVQTAVLEVGLGGRLDATNVVEAPTVTVITRIAFDHEDKLGNTLALIAAEKAGILKSKRPLVLGNIEGEAKDAILARAKSLDVPITFALQDARATSLATRAKLALLGAHQIENAIVAAAAAAFLGASDDEIVTGLERAQWPGRLETVSARGATWLLDCAHNPDGAQALANHLKANAPPYDALVFGALADKNWRDMLEMLAKFAKNRVYTTPMGRAPASPDAMRALHDGRMAISLDDALDVAASLAKGGRIVVAGSIYLVGEARAKLLDLPRDPAVAL